MKNLKYGLGVVLFLLISCVSEEIPDHRRDKVLVKEIISSIGHPRDQTEYQETFSFFYNKQALLKTLELDLEYKDRFTYDPETDKFPNNVIKSKTHSTFLYNDKNLVDREIKSVDGVTFTKKFIYNPENQLITIEEKHRTTHFYYNNMNLVGQIDMIYPLNDFPNSHHVIQYYEDGNIKEVYYTNLTSSFYATYELFELENPFAKSNINLSLKPGNTLHKYRGYELDIPDFLDNFEFVYKGNKVLKMVKTNSDVKGISQHHTILETKYDLPFRMLRNDYIQVYYSY